MWKNRFTEQLGITYPIIKAPMLGCENPEFVAAACNAGILGAYGVGRANGHQIMDVIRRIRQLTNRPFAINLFIPEKQVEGIERVPKVNRILHTYRQELGITENPFTPPEHNLEEQLNVILEEKVPVCSFTFGYLERHWVQELQKNGTVVLGTATNVSEAIHLEHCGVDFIVAQGSEAGGHRGTFLGNPYDSLIGTMALLPQIVNAVKTPVIAAGGIMDGRGMVASFALGAMGVQMGTAFLTCEESAAHPQHKEGILNSTEEQSCLTTTFSGKPARGLRNRFKMEMEHYTETIPGYPIQDSLTRDIREAAAKQSNPNFMALWAGQATRLSRSQTVRELVDRTIAEANEVLNQLKSLS